MSNLSVIIPSRNIDNLRPCVAAVRKHEPEAHIILVDDDDLAACNPGDVDDIVDGIKPFIFARACNQGIRAAGEDDVILLNDDALLESPGGFSIMQTAAQEHQEYGIIGAVTNLTGQPLQYRASRRDTLMAVADAMIPRIPAPTSLHDYGKQYAAMSSDGLREVPHIAFVCVLIPRRTRQLLADSMCVSLDPDRNDYLTDGFLDERYCLDWGCEDADYCEQVRVCRAKIGVHDGCYVDHGSLRSTRRGDPRTPTDFRQNYKLLVDKWGGYLITQPILRHLLLETDI